MRRVATSTALLVAVLLTGCGDDADPATGAGTEPGTGARTGAATATTAAGEATAGATAALVEVGATDLGDVLVDGDGMTLYVFDADDVDTSACTDGCLDTWPPVLASEVSAGEGVTGELGTFTRDDGDVQVTVGGRPLYRYATDAEPGDTAGQGVGDAWWVVDPAGTAVTESGGGAGGDATDGATTESDGIYGGLVS